MNTAVSPPMDDAAIIRVLQASKAEAAAGRMAESDQLLARLAMQAPNHPAVLNELERRGHDVTRAGPWTLGRLCAVTRDPATGDLAAAANPRGEQGYAAGR